MKRYLIIFGFVIVASSIFFWKYLFLFTVMVEERAAGWIYEPNDVLKIFEENGEIKYSGPSIERKEIGAFSFIFYRRIYPFLKVQYKNHTLPLLFSPYVGPLYIYIPSAFIKIFGKNIFSLRLPCLITFAVFLFLYIKFAEKIGGLKGGISSAFFLILLPVFSARFLSLGMWNNTCVFVLAIYLVNKIKDMIERPLKSKDIFFLSIISGLMLHFHLLAGGTLFLSIFLSLLISAKIYKIPFQISSFWIGMSIFVFLLIILPFLPMLLHMKMLFYISGFGSRRNFFLAPLRALQMYTIGILLPSSFINLLIHGIIKKSAFFSLPSGMLLVLAFYLIIIGRKQGVFESFIFHTVIIFIFLSAFASVGIHHINYFVIFLIPFLFSSLLKNVKSISEIWIKRFIFVSLILNFIQSILIREDIKNSSLSLSVHKEVVEYIEKNNIEKIYNLAGIYGFEFISKKKVEVLYFWDYLLNRPHPYHRIGSSLLLARGGVIMVEKFKRKSVLTTGIGIEEIYSVAERIGLNVKILKQFPEKNPVIILMKVE